MTLRKMKQGDREPPFPFALSVNDVALDLSTKTVLFLMRNVETGQRKIAAAPTILDAANGLGEYRWADTDTDTPGLYRIEIEVTDSGGKRRTFPGGDDENDYVYLRVVPDL